MSAGTGSWRSPARSTRSGRSAATLRDAALLLHAVAGRDERDATSAPVPVPAELLSLPTGDDEAASYLRRPPHRPAAGVLRRGHGARRRRPRPRGRRGPGGGRRHGRGSLAAAHATTAWPAYYIIAPAEASSNLARYDGVKYGFADRSSGDYIADYLTTRGAGFGPEVKRRIMLGTYALSAGYYDAYYLKAQKVRTLIKADFDAVWAAGFDAIVAPISPTVAFPLGAKVTTRWRCTSRTSARCRSTWPACRGCRSRPASRTGCRSASRSSGRRGASCRCCDWPARYEGITARAPWRDLEPAELQPDRRSHHAQPDRTQASRAAAGGRGRTPEDHRDRPDIRLRHPTHDRSSISIAEAEPERPPLSTRVLARRVDEVPRSGIRRFFDIMATMTDVISLGVGEPDFDTPEQVIEAGRHSLAARRTHYTSNYGTIELRRALAHHLERLYGVRYDPTEEILITIGASEALDVAFRATLDPGDEVILHEPSYVSYRPALIFAGGVPVGVNTTIDEDFALDPAKVEAAITPRTKALLLNYPCNPTGAVLPHDVQDEIARIAVRHDLLVYTDEIYDRLVYGGYQMRTMAALPGMRAADGPDGRLLQGLRHDRLADRLHLRAVGDPRGHPQGPPVRDHVGADGGPGRRARGPQDRRAGRRADGRPVRPPPPPARRRVQRDRPADVRAERRLLRLPADHLHRPHERPVRRAAAARGVRGGRPGHGLRPRPARATSAAATPPARPS